MKITNEYCLTRDSYPQPLKLCHDTSFQTITTFRVVFPLTLDGADAVDASWSDTVSVISMICVEGSLVYVKVNKF